MSARTPLPQPTKADLLQTMFANIPTGKPVPKAPTPSKVPTININLAAGASLMLVLGDAKQCTMTFPALKGDTDAK